MRTPAAALLLCATALGCASYQYGNTRLYRRDAATVDAVLSEVQDALILAERRIQADPDFPDPEPRIDEVELTFQIGHTDERQAGLDLFIFSIGTKSKAGESSSYTVSLKQPCDVAGAGPRTVEEMTKFFVESLVAAARGARAARDPALPLELQEVKTELAFTIASTVEGGAEVEIVPFTPSLKGSRENTAAHKIAVTFAFTDCTAD